MNYVIAKGRGRYHVPEYLFSDPNFLDLSCRAEKCRLHNYLLKNGRFKPLVAWFKRSCLSVLWDGAPFFWWRLSRVTVKTKKQEFVKIIHRPHKLSIIGLRWRQVAGITNTERLEIISAIEPANPKSKFRIHGIDFTVVAKKVGMVDCDKSPYPLDVNIDMALTAAS